MLFFYSLWFENHSCYEKIKKKSLVQGYKKTESQQFSDALKELGAHLP